MALKPHPGARPPPARFAMLLAEHLLHVASVVGAEIERQEAQKAAEQLAVTHVRRALNQTLGARHPERRLHPPRLGVHHPRPKSVSR